jgi:polyisoprenoid-binding protein YceI
MSSRRPHWFRDWRAWRPGPFVRGQEQLQRKGVPSMMFQRAYPATGPRRRGGPHLVLLTIAIGSLLYGVAAGADDPPPGAIRFRGHVAVGSSEGEFRRWHITDAAIDEEHPERSSVAVVIDLTSLDTGNSTRDRHLRSAEFFEVDHYPTATVLIKGVEVEDAGHFTASVQLDLHGRSKTFPMRFAVVDRGARRIAGQMTLKRSDFGVGSDGGFFNPLRVDDEVQVMIEATVPPSQGSVASVPSQQAPERRPVPQLERAGQGAGG